MKAPENKAPATHPIALGSSFRELDEDEAARPFAFKVACGKDLFLAAGSEEQRDEWFNLVGHFADADRRKGRIPPSDKILTPRADAGGTHVVDAIEPTDIQFADAKGPKPAIKPPSQPAKHVIEAGPREAARKAPLPARDKLLTPRAELHGGKHVIEEVGPAELAADRRRVRFVTRDKSQQVDKTPQVDASPKVEVRPQVEERPKVEEGPKVE
ncbi:unnamed protein product, partial [Effrenium voratum]